MDYRIEFKRIMKGPQTDERIKLIKDLKRVCQKSRNLRNAKKKESAKLANREQNELERQKRDFERDQERLKFNEKQKNK